MCGREGRDEEKLSKKLKFKKILWTRLMLSRVRHSLVGHVIRVLSRPAELIFKSFCGLNGLLLGY